MIIGVGGGVKGADLIRSGQLLVPSTHDLADRLGWQTVLRQAQDERSCMSELTRHGTRGSSLG